MKILLTLLIVAFSFAAFAVNVHAQDKTNVAPILIQSLAGISSGKTASTDDEVVKKYGKGFFVENEGHLGGRYFTNPKQSFTLHAIIGVDGIIEQVELTKGLNVPAKSKSSSNQLITNQLEIKAKIGQGLRFGMSPKALLKKLGTPKSDTQKAGKRVIQYETDYEKDSRVGLYYSASFTFEKNRLMQVSIYDGC